MSKPTAKLAICGVSTRMTYALQTMHWLGDWLPEIRVLHLGQGQVPVGMVASWQR